MGNQREDMRRNEAFREVHESKKPFDSNVTGVRIPLPPPDGSYENSQTVTYANPTRFFFVGEAFAFVFPLT